MKDIKKQREWLRRCLKMDPMHEESQKKLQQLRDIEKEAENELDNKKIMN